MSNRSFIHVTDVVNAISQLIKCSKLRIKLGQEARKKFYKQHTIEVMMEKFDYHNTK